MKNSMGFSNYCCADSRGKAGGLSLFWKVGVELEVVFSNKNVIVALIYSDPSKCAWLLIAVHGPPYMTKKHQFWELMAEIIDSFVGAWLMIGDLNVITGSSEKLGGSQKGKCSSRCFQNFVSCVGAIDLGFCGPKFTWTNRRAG